MSLTFYKRSERVKDSLLTLHPALLQGATEPILEQEGQNDDQPQRQLFNTNIVGPRLDSFLCWNRHGNVTRRASALDPYAPAALEVSHYDREGLSGNPHYTDNKGCTMAALGPSGVLFGRSGLDMQRPEGDRNALLWYNNLAAWDSRQSWELKFSALEKLKCMAVGSDSLAVCTTGERKYLRIFSTGGLQLQCLQLKGEAVGVSAYGNMFFVVTATELELEEVLVKGVTAKKSNSGKKKKTTEAGNEEEEDEESFMNGAKKEKNSQLDDEAADDGEEEEDEDDEETEGDATVPGDDNMVDESLLLDELDRRRMQEEVYWLYLAENEGKSLKALQEREGEDHVLKIIKNVQYSYQWIEVDGATLTTVSEGPLNVTPRSRLIWSGINEYCSPCVADSKGVVWGLAPLSTSLAQQAHFVWTPVADLETLDSSSSITPHAARFLVDVKADHILVAQGRSDEFFPRPADDPPLRRLPMRIPLLGVNARQAKDSQAYFEESRLRNAIRAAMAKAVFTTGSTRFLPIEVVQDASRSELSVGDAASQYLESATEHTDNLALSLFNKMVNTNQLQKAFDATKLLTSLHALTATRDMAQSQGKTRLFEQISNLLNERILQEQNQQNHQNNTQNHSQMINDSQQQMFPQSQSLSQDAAHQGLTHNHNAIVEVEVENEAPVSKRNSTVPLHNDHGPVAKKQVLNPFTRR